MLEGIIGGLSPSVIKRVQGLQMDVPSDNCNREINSLLQRTVLLGGKRLRPLLTFLMADFFAVEESQVEVCASSIEMVHAASLSHDDVVDQARTRRGSPSINVASSNKRAVLAGDYLLSHVIVELTQLGKIELVREMSLVISALSEGEWLQLDAAERRHYSHDLIAKVAFCKTASVMSWCAVAPALIKGVGPKVVEHARDFGNQLGVAFQLLDDILDFSDISNKETHLDLKNGVVNAVVYEWFILHPEIYEKFKAGVDIVDLFHSDRLDEALSLVRKKALQRLNRCRELLDIMEVELFETIDSARLVKAKKPLLSLLKYLENRKM